MPHAFLKRSEQVVIALLLAAALGSIVGYWGIRAWNQNNFIEFDAAPPMDATFLIDINRADWPELTQLPGIGKTTAQSIVKIRQADGPFINLQDLEHRVRGVGPRTIAEITPFVLPMHVQKTSRGDR
jgi:competence protein ComEA